MPKKRHSYGIIVVLLLLLLALFLGLWRPNSKRNLIMTPSEHTNVTYFEVEAVEMPPGYQAVFCLYDNDCNYMQLCFSVPRGHSQPFPFFPTQFSIDGQEYLDYGTIVHDTWNKSYNIMLIEGVPNAQSVQCIFDGKIYASFIQ